MNESNLLVRVPLFAGLTDSDRAALAQRMRERTFAAGERVFAKDDRGTSMFVILSGSARVFIPAPEGTQIVVSALRTGEYFGELSLLDDQPRSASVEVAEETRLGEPTREELLEYLQHNQSALVALLSEVSGRLRKTNSMLSEHVAKDINKAVDEQLTLAQRLSDRVARLNGSWSFILFLVLLSGGWALVNAILPAPFDAYPYSFYNLFLAILVALQGPLIVMSQNRESMKDRMQSETDFKVNLKNEMGIEQIVRDLAALRTDMNARFGALERSKTVRDPSREVA